MGFGWGEPRGDVGREKGTSDQNRATNLELPEGSVYIKSRTHLKEYGDHKLSTKTI